MSVSGNFQCCKYLNGYTISIILRFLKPYLKRPVPVSHDVLDINDLLQNSLLPKEE